MSTPSPFRELHPAAKALVILVAVVAGLAAVGCVAGVGKWAAFMIFQWTP